MNVFANVFCTIFSHQGGAYCDLKAPDTYGHFHVRTPQGAQRAQRLGQCTQCEEAMSLLAWKMAKGQVAPVPSKGTDEYFTATASVEGCAINDT